MTREKHIACIMLVFSALLGGCFEEDQKVPPHVPGDEKSFAFERSIYDHQSYFDLGTNSILAENGNGEWVLRFGAMSGDWHVGVNSANYWGVYPTGTDNPDSIPADPPQEKWIFDNSSGDPDSSAFAGWVIFTDVDTTYTNELFLLGIYNGIAYKASWVMQLYHVDDSVYRFRLRTTGGADWQTFEVPKSPFHNYRYFTTSGGGKLVDLEPDQVLWDLQFSQYGSVLYTSDGVPTPYYVRGVLLNRYRVEAAVDTVNAFADIIFDDIASYTFSRRQDFIGYEWKDVEVDLNSNTAVYTVIPGVTYIIRDTEGFYYKFRFVSYYNDMGEKGFPVIEHLRL